MRMHTSLVFHNDSLNPVWNLIIHWLIWFFCQKLVFQINESTNYMYLLSLQIDRHLWDKNCYQLDHWIRIVSIVDIIVENKRKKEFYWPFSGKSLKLYQTILSQILSSYKIRILTIESFLIFYIFFFEKSSILLMKKYIKFSLIKKLLAPCRGLKKTEF